MHDFWNDWPRVIRGHEDTGADNSQSNEDPNIDDEDPDNASGDPSNQEQSDNTGSGGKTAEDFANLEKALQAERRNNKRLDREVRRLQAAQGQKQETENEDIEAERQKSQAAQARAEKLAAGLLRRDIDSAIREAARELKFIDVEDAIAGVDRSAIIADQDDEDPTDIDVDNDSVLKAVKALAAKKSHFIRKGTDDGEPTGNPNGGSRKRNKATAEEAYRAHYPSL